MVQVVEEDPEEVEDKTSRGEEVGHVNENGFQTSTEKKL